VRCCDGPDHSCLPQLTTPHRPRRTTVVILHLHTGVFGNVIALSVRHPKTGRRFRRVPLEVFAR
jgi:hypothetical protein